MLVNCDYCGKRFSKKNKYVEVHIHNFCCRKCYHQYRRENKDWIRNMNKEQDLSYQMKLKKLAEEYAERNKSKRFIDI